MAEWSVSVSYTGDPGSNPVILLFDLNTFLSLNLQSNTLFSDNFDFFLLLFLFFNFACWLSVCKQIASVRKSYRGFSHCL